MAIAGGGASGSLLAAELVRRDSDVRAIVIEPRERLGRGMAYSTECPAHLLNVPAARMSAFADVPDSFSRWLQDRRPGEFQPQSFVPRSIYGDYLGDIVASAARDAGGRLQHIRARATSVRVAGPALAIGSSDGSELRADALVLATGNAYPAPWPGLDAFSADGGGIYASAWDRRALAPAYAEEPVLLLGTGLTAVDAVLGLRYNGHRGIVHMVSRRGLLPNEHRFFDSPPAAAPEAQGMADLFSAVRLAAKESATGTIDWRVTVDRLRPRTNALWQALTLEEQRRFVRHALPYWNVHRHRMAPEVAQVLAALCLEGRLRMHAGYTRDVVASGKRFAVRIDLRGKCESLALEVERIINCSGPEHDVRKLDNPLLADLLEQGCLQPHALGVGVDVDPDGALRDRAGRSSDRFFTLGPIRYGTLIETTAIPEIRVQVRDLASVLLEGACAARVTGS